MEGDVAVVRIEQVIKTDIVRITLANEVIVNIKVTLCVIRLHVDPKVVCPQMVQ